MDGETMRMYGFLATLVACGGDNGFTPGNNDPATQEGTGAAEFYPTSLDFADCDPTISYSAPFKVTNVGDATLAVYEVTIVEGDGTFYVEDMAQFELEPKDAREIQVVATLATAKAADGVLEIKTSDPDALSFQMPLHAEPALPDTGP